MPQRLRVAVGVAAVFLLHTAMPAAAAGVSVQGDVQVTPFKIEGFTAGVEFRVDAKYAAANKIDVPAPFSTVIPRSKSFETLVVHAPKPGSAFTKFNFVSPDRKRLYENLQFVPMKLPLIPVEKRLQAAAELAAKDGVRMVTAGKQNATRDVIRRIKVGAYDAVEVIGSYSDPDLGRISYRLVGILNPSLPDSVMAVAKVVDKEVKVPTPDDMAKTSSGVAVQRFKYLGK